MSWLINGKTPEELGVTVAGWTESVLVASEFRLETVAKFHHTTTPPELAYDNLVTVTFNGQQVFLGRVRETPRQASPNSEGASYIIKDAFDMLDRIVYHEQREFVDSIAYDADFSVVSKSPKNVGMVFFDDDERLGQRITKVLQYAIFHGANLQIGSIPAGLKWFRTEYKDQACGEIIRDIMRLMPEYILYINNRTSTPTVNLVNRSSLSSVGFDINSGNEIIDHNITSLDSQLSKGVVINYEIPITVDGDNHTYLVQDTAGNTEGLDVVVETVGLKGGTFESEYARVVTRPIPPPKEDNDYNEELTKRWWIEQTPELAHIADLKGMSDLLSFLKIANTSVENKNVTSHSLTVIVDDIERPEPLNPNATPLVDPIDQTDLYEDYRNQLIEGTLPEWANKRYRRVRAAATFGVIKSELESIADESLRVMLEELFNIEKEFDGNTYMTANFNAEVMGTNAITQHYKRVVTFDLNEEPPQGIAQQLLDQFNKLRFTGNVVLSNKEIRTDLSINKNVFFTGGRASWQTMREPVQSIDFDVQTGQVDLSFGPIELMGANDLIERLRAARRNPYSHKLRSDKDVEEGVGGTAATPINKFNRVSGGGGEISECVLGEMITDPVSGSQKLRPGVLNFNGSVMLDTESDGFTINPSAGDGVWLEVEFEAEVVDDYLTGGASYTSHRWFSDATDADNQDELPTPSSPNGKHFILMYWWEGDGDSIVGRTGGCGNIHMTYCAPSVVQHHRDGGFSLSYSDGGGGGGLP